MKPQLIQTELTLSGIPSALDGEEHGDNLPIIVGTVQIFDII